METAPSLVLLRATQRCLNSLSKTIWTIQASRISCTVQSHRIIRTLFPLCRAKLQRLCSGQVQTRNSI